MFKSFRKFKWLNIFLFLVFMVGAIVLAEQYVLPDMQGWDMVQIKQYVTANDVELNYEYEYSDDVLYGTVMNQVTCDETESCDLDLVISIGKDMTQASKVEVQAYLSELIEQELIKPGTVTYEDSDYSNEIEKDYILSYEADPYADQITLSFSLGKEVLVYEASMVAVGDILLHNTVYEDFQTSELTYDFTNLFKDIAPYIEEADFAFVNQETNIGGAEIGVSSYPNFNSPYEIVDALQAVGFNMYSRANNHTLDRGVESVLNASRKFDSMEGIIHAGATDTQEKRNTVAVIEKNGITLSLLSYTYGFNGYVVPTDMPYLANLFDYKQAAIDIEKAKQESDVVVVSMHWGAEYQSLASDEQKEQAQWLADQGVHIIVGHHPHVLQPIETIVTESGHETVVMYSLGNFVSAQSGLEKLVGGIASLDITKTIVGDEEPIIEIDNVMLMPTYNYPNGSFSDYKIIPLIESVQSSYFETVETIIKTYDEEIEVVEYITYNKD